MNGIREVAVMVLVTVAVIIAVAIWCVPLVADILDAVRLQHRDGCLRRRWRLWRYGIRRQSRSHPPA